MSFMGRSIFFLYFRLRHRDLKPEQILLARDGHVVVSDFLLNSIKPPADRTSSIGPPVEYFSPEILRGEGVTKASDYWSFGNLIYEMLEGLPPFYSQDVTQMYSNILAGVLKL